MPAERGQPEVRQPTRDGPTTATPWPARSAARLTLIAPITAISGPGILRVIRRAASTTTMTPVDTARSVGCTCGSARTMSRSLVRVFLPVAVTPSMSGSCPAATWIPTPVRNPIRTVRDRKFARNPSLASRASSSIPPASRAASPASRTYRSDPAAASPVSAAARMAAVAESAADDEMARRTEDGEHGHRQQQRVQAGHHRHPGDLRVPESLRDAQGGQRHAGEHVPRHLRPANRQQPPHHRQGPQPSPLVATARSRHRHLLRCCRSHAGQAACLLPASWGSQQG